MYRMAAAPCIRTATFSRCAPGARLYLRPSRAPATWTTTAGTECSGWHLSVQGGGGGGRRPQVVTGNAQGQMEAAEEPSFNVASPDVYNNFGRNYVQRMRNMLRGQRSDVVDAASGDVVPVARLPRQVDDPDLMNLTLRDGEESVVTLSVRTDNLYVVGFRNREGPWFELRHHGDRAPMIPGSTYLRFDGRYDEGGIGKLSTGDAILGLSEVVKAIKGLSDFSGTDYSTLAINVDAINDEKTITRFFRLQKQLKGFLRVLIVNFIESVRFDTIAGQVGDQMSNPSEDGACLDMKQTLLIRNWGGLSHALMQAVNNPDPALQEHYWSSFNSLGIHNLADAGGVLGMVLVSTASRSRTVRPRCAVGAGAIGGGGGLTLAEVVSIDADVVDGKINITDGLGTLQTYNRAQLVAPRTISGADDFVIDVYRNRRPALVQVAVWNPRDGSSRDYNRILRGQDTGEYGYVDVQYAVLTDAVVAMVEVVVVDANVPGDSWDVYGSVTARTAMDSGQPLQYTLLDKARGQPAQVLKNTAIPLQRQLVSAPLSSTLEVSANLRDKGVPDHEITNVSVVFTPRLNGTDTADIAGPCGMVRVNVTWSLSFSSE